MPRPHPLEFRRRAVELANQRGPDGERLQPVAKTTGDLGISESCLRNWMTQADIDRGARPGLATDERRELAELRRRNRVLEMEVEILKRASAYFARENVLPK
jgi:transposase